MARIILHAHPASYQVINTCSLRQLNTHETRIHSLYKAGPGLRGAIRNDPETNFLDQPLHINMHVMRDRLIGGGLFRTTQNYV